MADDVVVLIQREFAARGVTLPVEWLAECLDFLKTHVGPNAPANVLMPLVEEQWMKTDLADLGVPSLPLLQLSAKHTVLHGPYCLQLVWILDIGKSAYSQFKKFENENDLVSEENKDENKLPPWEEKPKRCLYLELTDGVNNVKAMEHSSIGQLHTDVAPGTKLLISGPVECRRGVMLLSGSQVKLLGGTDGGGSALGQAELLAKRLNLPPPSRPVQGHVENQDFQNHNSNGSDEEDAFLAEIAIDEAALGLSQAAELATVSAVETTTPSSPSVHTVINNRTRAAFLEPSSSSDRGPTTSAASNPQSSACTSRESDMEIGQIEFKSPSGSRSVDRKAESPVSSGVLGDVMEGLELDSVRHLLAIDSPDYCDFFVKVRCSGITRHLNSNAGRCWSLGIRLSDATGSIEVRVADPLIQSIVGCSAQLAEGLAKLKSKVKNLDDVAYLRVARIDGSLDASLESFL